MVDVTRFCFSMHVCKMAQIGFMSEYDGSKVGFFTHHQWRGAHPRDGSITLSKAENYSESQGRWMFALKPEQSQTCWLRMTALLSFSKSLVCLMVPSATFLWP
jgi:hypothetical protein